MTLERQRNGLQPSSSSSSLTVAVATRRRSIPSINEERSRFRIVKIDSYVDRGRWHCHNFADPDPHDAADIGTAAGQDDGRGSGADGTEDDPGPSQIYYIAAPGGQNDGHLSDLSRKFYVSTIVYGEHGHPVLDRTVRMSPLQLLQRGSDVALPPADEGDTLTPSPRGRDSNLQSPADPTVDDADDADDALLQMTFDCFGPLDDDGGGGRVASDPETGDVTQNDPVNPFSGVAMAAHSSMPPLSDADASAGYDDVSRRPVTSLPPRRQDDEEMGCHDDSVGQPGCPTLRLLAADDCHSTRLALSFNFSIRFTHIQSLTLTCRCFMDRRDFLEIPHFGWLGSVVVRASDS